MLQKSRGQYADSAYVIHELCNEALKVTIARGDIERMYRLGRKGVGKTRPLLVQFKDEAKKMVVFSHVKELKAPTAHFKGVSIRHDLTPIQREQDKKVYQEAKYRLAAEQASSDDTESGNMRT